jgi:signal transduction histidine kinase
MVDGMPDALLFKASIGSAIARANQQRPSATIYAYGEMVDVLWDQGRGEAAMRLEDLWNDLARSHAFSLLCGYSMGRFAGEAQSVHFDRICGQHAHVIPLERFTELADTRSRLREIAFLQQRAGALQVEIERRKAVEGQLRQALADREVANRLTDEFLAVLSHELRTPLNTILGWTHIVTDARSRDSETGAVRCAACRHWHALARRLFPHRRHQEPSRHAGPDASRDSRDVVRRRPLSGESDCGRLRSVPHEAGRARSARTRHFRFAASENLAAGTGAGLPP